MTLITAVEVPAPVLLLIVVAIATAAFVASMTITTLRRRLAGAELDRRRAETAAAARQALMTETRARLELALEAIAPGVLIADGDARVVFRNRAARTYAEARHGDALVEAAVGDLLRAAVDGVAGQRTVDLFGPPRRTLVIKATPLTEVGSPDDGQGALVVIDDISARRRLDATRRDFVANISHELKTPVGAVGLLAEALAAEDDPAVARRLADRIVDEAFRLDRTIEDLLVLSRIEGDDVPSHDPVPVHAVIDDALGRIRPAAEQAGIGLEVAPLDRSMRILGDRRQLVSALFNLLDNAVKYSDPGAVVQVSARGSGDRIELSVVDHGIGIPKADLERVFERFYRVDQARSRTTGGTGLGLAIVRHVATNHEGDVHVTSRLGDGSTFTLDLPAAHPGLEQAAGRPGERVGETPGERAGVRAGDVLRTDVVPDREAGPA